ncbi:hypothetical protein E0Z10_g7636 [Xylaria hypoxylon]|uniref:Uncharacterized protein n=1 Tax=Xylaria hypoxylon TaxID=37992 RepID=A0A4Z0YA93_9PEZI|nr:hypothetical protein E0Z10_g7636 [Xylaria hypoxylon]
MSHKAPSAGTKVSAGPNDPKIQEGLGAVEPDSLAAESQAFSQANSAGLDNQQSRPQEGASYASASARAPGTSHSQGGGGMPREAAGGGAHTHTHTHTHTAPSYVGNQYHRDPSGPHGKNIKEDDSIGTGDTAKNASFTAEIGSKDDPSLLAERKLDQANSVAPGSSGGREKTVDNKTTYDVLGDQTA